MPDKEASVGLLSLALLGGVAGFTGLAVGGLVLNGLALTIIWGWFIVPIFGLPQLTIAPAIGVTLIVRYLTHQIQPTDPTKTVRERVWSAVGNTVFEPLFVLLFGWIVHLFM